MHNDVLLAFRCRVELSLLHIPILICINRDSILCGHCKLHYCLSFELLYPGLHVACLECKQQDQKSNQNDSEDSIGRLYRYNTTPSSVQIQNGTIISRETLQRCEGDFHAVTNLSLFFTLLGNKQIQFLMMSKWRALHKSQVGLCDAILIKSLVFAFGSKWYYQQHVNGKKRSNFCMKRTRPILKTGMCIYVGWL